MNPRVDRRDNSRRRSARQPGQRWGGDPALDLCTTGAPQSMQVGILAYLACAAHVSGTSPTP